MNPADAQLMRAVSIGDEAALAQLYERHAGRLYGEALRFVGATGEAEELVHDIFLACWHQAWRFDATRGSVRTWLLVRLRSRALDRLRRRKRPIPPLLPPDPPDPSLVADLSTVCTRLDGLPETQRQIVELAYFEGLTRREIGERLGLAVGTVKSRLAAGLNQLRLQLVETEPT